MKSVTPYGRQDSGKKQEVEEMFDHIAPSYDLLNRTLSMGIDRSWRKKAIAELKALKPGKMLDVATGTGDFAIESMRLEPEKITGIDIAGGMLEKGRSKIERLGLTGRIELIKADSENLPFDQNSFDAATVAFGVRNFEDLDRGLAEIARVLKSGGRLVVLEFSKPTTFGVKQLFNLYFSKILPGIGRLVSKDKRAYAYLFESVQVFPEGEDFLERLKKAGFKNVKCKRLSFGICSIYTGDK